MDPKDRLTAWFLSNYGTIVKIAYAYTPSAGIVDDITQSVYVEFVDEAAQEPDQAQWILLLRRITYRVVKRHWDELYRNNSEKLREIGLHLTRMNMDEFQGRHFEEELDALRRCLKKLPEKSGKLVEMYYFSGISSATIGKRFNVTARAINKAIYRIRETLRFCIEHLSEKERPNVG